MIKIKAFVLIMILGFGFGMPFLMFFPRIPIISISEVNEGVPKEIDLPVVIVSAEIDKRDIVRAFRKFSVSNVILKQYFEYDEFYAAVRDALPVRAG